MKKAKRRLKKVDISFISLCPRGANQMPVIYKEDGTFELSSLVKELGNFEEKGELLNVVYVPETTDAQGDIADAEVVKEAAYSYMLNGAEVDLRHDTKALSKEDAFVAESFIIQKGDSRFEGMTDLSGEPVDVTGAWATVIKVNNPELRKKYSEGEWNGVSMYGKAAVENLEKEEDSEESVKDLLLKMFPTFANLLSKAKEDNKPETKEEIEMNKEELVEAMAANNTALIEGLTKALKGEPEKKDEKVEKTDEPSFKGDPSDRQAVAKWLNELEVKKQAESVDWTDPESIKSYLAGLEKEDKGTQEPAPSNIGIQKQDKMTSNLSKEQEDDTVSRMAAHGGYKEAK